MTAIVQGGVPFTKSTFPEGTELRIKYFKGGYGDDWLKAMEAKFEEDYPGVDVILIPSTNETEFTQTISTTLNTSPDDIYICHNIPYERLSVNNLVMNLDTLYNSVIYTDTKNTESTDDDTPVRFVDRVATSSLNLVRFNGHYVAIPEIQGVGGIAYNKTLFDANGWEIPETYEELAALAETIYTGDYKNAEGEKVYPFVWSGTVAYMWDSFVYDMWVQIAGIDEFNTFMKYESKDLFDSSKYPALKQAWTYWYNLICAHQEYSHPQSLGFDHLQANTAFAAGQAAMMPASCWTANEIGSAILEAFGTDVGLIPTPFVKEAQKDSDGNPIRVAYDMAGKDVMIIAQKGKNKQVAVEFFKWMAIEENARLFPRILTVCISRSNTILSIFGSTKAAPGRKIPSICSVLRLGSIFTAAARSSITRGRRSVLIRREICIWKRSSSTGTLKIRERPTAFLTAAGRRSTRNGKLCARRWE